MTGGVRRRPNRGRCHPSSRLGRRATGWRGCAPGIQATVSDLPLGEIRLVTAHVVEEDRQVVDTNDVEGRELLRQSFSCPGMDSMLELRRAEAHPKADAVGSTVRAELREPLRLLGGKRLAPGAA